MLVEPAGESKPARWAVRQTGLMDSDSVPLALVVIAGPQASGKSTLATALSVELRRQDAELVILDELDEAVRDRLPPIRSILRGEDLP